MRKRSSFQTPHYLPIAPPPVCRWFLNKFETDPVCTNPLARRRNQKRIHSTFEIFLYTHPLFSPLSLPLSLMDYTSSYGWHPGWSHSRNILQYPLPTFVVLWGIESNPSTLPLLFQNEPDLDDSFDSTVGGSPPNGKQILLNGSNGECRFFPNNS